MNGFRSYIPHPNCSADEILAFFFFFFLTLTILSQGDYECISLWSQPVTG